MSFYKNQNSDLMGRLDEYEKIITCKSEMSSMDESNRNSVNILMDSKM